MNRRQFLAAAVAGSAAAAALPNVMSSAADAPTSKLPEPTIARLPRWRGFNLLEYFDGRRARPFLEKDFELIAELGFDIVRLPLSYLAWNPGKPETWEQIDEKALKPIDDAVDWGRRYGIHVNVNFHRAPGYCVNPPDEPLSLWESERALEACAAHWAHFAGRYKGRTNRDVTFNLLNEPKDIPEPIYAKVVKRLVAAIHEQDKDRLIVADGLKWGGTPCPSLVGVVAQSTRGYQPSRVTHFDANWVEGSEKWPTPTWPIDIEYEGKVERWDKAKLGERVNEWKALAAKGCGIHVGECGAYNRTPHGVVLAWMKDMLGLWRDASVGWAMWNFRGSFGPIDSGRKDVQYENWKGHKLDRAMLELIRQH
jgi:endoglucanase